VYEIVFFIFKDAVDGEKIILIPCLFYILC
jgi:hypothetical protein